MKVFSLICLLIVGCAPYYADDPNSHTLVTSRYENSPEEITSVSKCKPMVDCTSKTLAECSISHYNSSDKYVREGERLITKKLYLSAKIEFMQAICRLEVADILLEQAKLDNFQDYLIIIRLGLKQKIKDKIKLCDKRISFLRWK